MAESSHCDTSFLKIAPQLRIAMDEFEWSYVRSSGPGGQNVNKVNSKAVLRWRAVASLSLPRDVLERFIRVHGHRLTNDGEVIISSQRFRDAPRNAADCLEKLRSLLAGIAVAPRARKATRPSRGSVHRRLAAKRIRSDKKQSRRRHDSGDD